MAGGDDDADYDAVETKDADGGYDVGYDDHNTYDAGWGDWDYGENNYNNDDNADNADANDADVNDADGNSSARSQKSRRMQDIDHDIGAGNDSSDDHSDDGDDGNGGDPILRRVYHRSSAISGAPRNALASFASPLEGQVEFRYGNVEVRSAHTAQRPPRRSAGAGETVGGLRAFVKAHTNGAASETDAGDGSDAADSAHVGSDRGSYRDRGRDRAGGESRRDRRDRDQNVDRERHARDRDGGGEDGYTGRRDNAADKATLQHSVTTTLDADSVQQQGHTVHSVHSSQFVEDDDRDRDAGSEAVYDPSLFPKSSQTAAQVSASVNSNTRTLPLHNLNVSSPGAVRVQSADDDYDYDDDRDAVKISICSSGNSSTRSLANNLRSCQVIANSLHDDDDDNDDDRDADLDALISSFGRDGEKKVAAQDGMTPPAMSQSLSAGLSQIRSLSLSQGHTSLSQQHLSQPRHGGGAAFVDTHLPVHAPPFSQSPVVFPSLASHTNSTTVTPTTRSRRVPSAAAAAPAAAQDLRSSPRRASMRADTNVGVQRANLLTSAHVILGDSGSESDTPHFAASPVSLRSLGNSNAGSSGGRRTASPATRASTRRTTNLSPNRPRASGGTRTRAKGPLPPPPPPLPPPQPPQPHPSASPPLPHPSHNHNYPAAPGLRAGTGAGSGGAGGASGGVGSGGNDVARRAAASATAAGGSLSHQSRRWMAAVTGRTSLAEIAPVAPFSAHSNRAVDGYSGGGGQGLHKRSRIAASGGALSAATTSMPASLSNVAAGASLHGRNVTAPATLPTRSSSSSTAVGGPTVSASNAGMGAGSAEAGSKAAALRQRLESLSANRSVTANHHNNNSSNANSAGGGPGHVRGVGSISNAGSMPPPAHPPAHHFFRAATVSATTAYLSAGAVAAGQSSNRDSSSASDSGAAAGAAAAVPRSGSSAFHSGAAGVVVTGTGVAARPAARVRAEVAFAAATAAAAGARGTHTYAGAALVAMGRGDVEVPIHHHPRQQYQPRPPAGAPRKFVPPQQQNQGQQQPAGRGSRGRPQVVAAVARAGTRGFRAPEVLMRESAVRVYYIVVCIL